MHSTVLLPNEKKMYLCADGWRVQHYCNENWWALVWITGVSFLSIGGINRLLEKIK